MNRIIAVTGTLIAGLLYVSHANAQLAVAKVVASCGTTSPTPSPGLTYPLTMDITGTLCTVGGGGGGGGLSVTDRSAFTAGSSLFTPVGGQYNSSQQTVTSGQSAMFAMSPIRSEYIDTQTTNNNLYTAVTAPTTDPATPAHWGLLAQSSSSSGALGQLSLSVSSGNVVSTIQMDKSAAININTTVATLLVSAGATVGIYVGGWDVTAGGSGTFTLEYGTQTTNPCDTGTTALTGSIPMVAQQEAGRSGGVVFFIPAGNQLCAQDSTVAQFSGSVSYTKW